MAQWADNKEDPSYLPRGNAHRSASASADERYRTGSSTQSPRTSQEQISTLRDQS